MKTLSWCVWVCGLMVSSAAFAAGFSNAASMNTARYVHTATLLPNGHVLVVGGTSDGTNGLSSAERYDPTNNTWVSDGNLNTPRSLHSATLLPTGAVLIAGGVNGGSYPNNTELYNPSSKTWSVAGNLSAGRYYHTATLLPNGKVLVAGGQNNSGILNGAELYDPAVNSWAPAGNLMIARFQHTAMLLSTGKVLVVGGTGNSGFLSSAELYDPANNTWSTVGSLNTLRYFHTMTLLPNGKALVAAGDSGPAFLNSAELFDSGQNTWSAAGSLNTARYLHTMTLLPSGKVLVAGGFNGGYLSSTEMYDPSTNLWTSAGNLNAARRQQTATVLASGKVLIVGGNNGGSLNSVELYDPTSGGSWSATGSLATGRRLNTATLLPSGKVLVAGGYDSTSKYLSSAELYDPANNTWNAAASLGNGRIYHTVTLLPSGKVLVAGGGGNSGFLSSAELYDPSSDTWSAAGSLGTARGSHTATLLLNGKVLVAGGQNNETAYLSSAEVYDPASNTWSTVGSMGTGRFAYTATLLPSGKVLAAGGFNGFALSSAEVYDPANNTWSVAGSLSNVRTNHTATLLFSGKLLVAGGQGSTGYLTSAEVYDPASNTWSAAGNLSTGRTNNPAKLLPCGKVLVVGGDHNGALISAEVYDSASNTWSAAGSLGTARSDHTATLLSSGKVLVAGGQQNGNSALTSAELYDPGLGFNSVWQPAISSATSPLTLGSALTLTGTQFTGYQNESASGGATNDSASNIPVVQLQSLVNEQQLFLQPDPAHPWSATSYTSLPVTGFSAGYASVRVFVNGIPSAASIISVASVQAASTTTAAVNASTLYSTPSKNVTLSAIVTSTGGMVNEGMVTFQVKNGASNVGNPLTSSTVSGGIASVSYVLPATTAINTYTIVATYGSGSNFAGSSDNTHTLTVNQNTTTTNAANVSTPFSVSAQNVTLTATVTSPGGTVNEGTVSFQVMDGATKIGSAVVSPTVSNGSASVMYSLPAGTAIKTYTIVATYANGTNFSGSSDGSHNLAVGLPSSTTAANNASTVFNTSAQNVTLSATVISSGGTVNQGTVAFQVKNGAANVGNAVTSTTVSNGTASVSYSLPAGTTVSAGYTIAASYVGGSSFANSNDSTHTLIVTSAGTTTSATNASTTFNASSQNVTLTATVTSTGGAVNEGTVSFQVMNGATNVGSAVVSSTVSSGNASVLYALPPGTSITNYTIVATYANGTNFAGSSDNTHVLTVTKIPASVNLGSLLQTYDGNSKLATATTSPSNLTVTFTYNGNATPPTNSGSYAVVGTISDGTYQGTASGTLMINKALLTVNLSNLIQTYDGTPKTVFASTTPVSASLAITYNGSSTPPINAGLYTVNGTVTDSNYSGTNVVQLIIAKAAASVSLSNLTQAFDGTPKSVGVTTIPAGLTVTVTYNGNSAAPTTAGNYPIVATINDTNYQGSSSATFTIAGPAAKINTQTASFPVTTPASAAAQNITLSATVTPIGGSGAVNEGTVTFQVLDGSTVIGSAVTSAAVSGGNVSVNYLLPANITTKIYTISAAYSGTSNFAASSDTTKTLTVFGGTNPPGILPLTVDRNPAVVNTPLTITANAQSNSGLPLTYAFNLFNHGNATPIGVLQSALPNFALTTTFSIDGDFDISVVVSDGFTATATSTNLEVFPLGPNSGTSAANIFNANGAASGYMNAANNLGVVISKSKGGALNLDATVNGAVPAAAGDTYTFTIPEQTRKDPARKLTGAKFSSVGIKVVVLDAVIGGQQKKARIMVPIGQSEVGASSLNDNRPSKGQTAFSVSGTLAAPKAGAIASRGKTVNTSIKYTANVDIASGLSLSELSTTDMPISVGMSNFTTTMTLDAKGKVVQSSLSDPTHFQKMQIKLPKLDKSKKTVSGAQMTFSFTLTGNDAATSGFDTDGVTSGSSGSTAARNLQFAAIVAGMSYQGTLTVTTTTDSFGNVTIRSK